MPADSRGVYSALRTAVSRLRERRAASGHAPRGRAPEATRVQAALEMHELGVRMYRQRMHREHPQATRRDIWTPTGFVDTIRSGTMVYEERTGRGTGAQEVHPGI
jgi:Rv0078B-related antitoxin